MQAHEGTVSLILPLSNLWQIQSLALSSVGAIEDASITSVGLLTSMTISLINTHGIRQIFCQIVAPRQMLLNRCLTV
jgi:hypothetical protein